MYITIKYKYHIVEYHIVEYHISKAHKLQPSNIN